MEKPLSKPGGVVVLGMPLEPEADDPSPNMRVLEGRGGKSRTLTRRSLRGLPSVDEGGVTGVARVDDDGGGVNPR
jgi:hypothetical protein